MVADQSFNDFLRLNETTWNDYKAGKVPFENRQILIRPKPDLYEFFFGIKHKTPNILPYYIALYNFN